MTYTIVLLVSLILRTKKCKTDLTYDTANKRCGYKLSHWLYQAWHLPKSTEVDDNKKLIKISACGEVLIN